MSRVESPIEGMSWKKLSELEPNPDNPRIHPESSIAKIRNSVERFGFVNPMLVVDGVRMVAGHGRLKAVREQNGEDVEVPVVELDLSLEEAEAYMLADNRIQEESGWEPETLARDLDAMDEDLVDAAGFDDLEVEDLMDFEPEEPNDEFPGVEPDEQRELDLVECPSCGEEFNT